MQTVKSVLDCLASRYERNISDFRFHFKLSHKTLGIVDKWVQSTKRSPTSFRISVNSVFSVQFVLVKWFTRVWHQWDLCGAC